MGEGNDPNAEPSAGSWGPSETTRQLLATTLDGYILADADGQIREVNASYCRMVGRTRHELLTKNIRELEGKLSGTEIQSRIRQIMESGGARFKTRHRHQDGQLVELDVSITVLKQPDGSSLVAAFVRDITAETRARDALLQSEAFTRLLLDSAAESIYGVDLDGLCTFCNQACVDLLGYSSSEELVGRNMAELIQIEASNQEPQEFSQRPRNSRQRPSELTRFCKRDGTMFAVELWSHPIVQEGQVIGAVVTFVDDTDRRELEKQLRHSQKMEAIGRMAGGIAHDFNNILQAIATHAWLAQNKLQGDHPALDDLQQILATANRAHNLTKQLLSFSRQEPLEPVNLAVNDVVGSVIRMLKPMLGDAIKLDLQLSSEPLMVHAGPGQLSQVLLNLCLNARDAMPQGGRLFISTQLGSGASSAPQATIVVKDNGTGISHNLKDQVFEPFFTTKQLGEGSGLGLSVAYGIVEQLGGTIEFTTASETGTEFQVCLPCVHTNPPVPSSDIREDVQHGKETILLAEDNASVRKATEAMLCSLGYEVLAATNGVEALELFAAHRQRIRLLLTDSVMPEIDGATLYQRLKDVDSNLKTVILSGYSEDCLTRIDTGDPNLLFLQKPVSSAKLSTSIRSLLELSDSE